MSVSPYDPPDPHDPLAPRPDDPRIGGWWWWRGGRADGRRARFMFFRWPLWIVLMMLVVSFVALGVVLIFRHGGG